MRTILMQPKMSCLLLKLFIKLHKERVFDLVLQAKGLLQKQPPRPINEISVRRGYLPGKCLSVRGIGVSWKIICARRLE